MIVKSAFRCVGNLAPHLLRTDTNRSVRIEVGFIRNAPEDVEQALVDFELLARTNSRCQRDFAHFKISPDHIMTDDDLGIALAMIENEFGIDADAPRHVVRHEKGDRAPHFHVNYPIVDVKSGRAIRSAENFLKDELISRRLELQFGEKVRPGPRQEEVVKRLQRRGLTQEAEALGKFAPVYAGDRLGTDARQQAERTGVALDHLVSAVGERWVECGGHAVRFAAALDRVGIDLARGDHAVMIVHRETGASFALERVLRQHLKAIGRPGRIRRAEMDGLFPDLKPLTAVRDAGLDRAEADARKRLLDELSKAERDAAADGDRVFREIRERITREKAAKAEVRRTLKARREAIRAVRIEQTRIRRERVDRAFRIARIVDHPAWRKLVFIAAAGAVTLGGGGIGLALIAGGVAVGALPSRERARMLAASAQDYSKASYLRMVEELSALYTAAKIEEAAAHPSKETGNLIRNVPSDKRLVGAFYTRRVLARENQQAPETALDKIVGAHLGEPLVTAINDALRAPGAGVLVAGLLRAYRPRRREDRDALRNILAVAEPVSKFVEARAKRAPARSRKGIER